MRPNGEDALHRRGCSGIEAGLGQRLGVGHRIDHEVVQDLLARAHGRPHASPTPAGMGRCGPSVPLRGSAHSCGYRCS